MRARGPTWQREAVAAWAPSGGAAYQQDLPNVSTVIWLEGINDFGNAGAEPTAVADGVRDDVKRLRAAIPGVKIFMATLTSSLNSTNGAYGSPAVEEKRRAYNTFIKTSGIFDGVIDFDAAHFA